MTRGAGTLRLALVVGKVRQSKQAALLFRTSITLFAPLQGAVFLSPLLVSWRVYKRRVALTVVAVSDVYVRASLVDRGDHGFAVKTTVGGYLSALEDISAWRNRAKCLARCLDDRGKQVPFVA